MNQKVMNRLHGRRQDKVDYFMKKNYDKMSTLERDKRVSFPRLRLLGTCIS